MNRSVTPAELRRWLEEGRDLQILDVRKKTDFEADNHMFATAKWMDPERVADWTAGLSQKATIVVYCVHGHAVSNGVVDGLRARGLNACLIEGGIEGWKAAGGSTVKKQPGA
ncbi:MAG: rhodanese-like domain-containing protein [Acidiferrobacterales bacterium]